MFLICFIAFEIMKLMVCLCNKLAHLSRIECKHQRLWPHAFSGCISFVKFEALAPCYVLFFFQLFNVAKHFSTQ